MDLDDALDELYGCARAEFVDRRRDLTRSARSAGNPDLAREISRVRKPTQVAWLLNQWIRRSPSDLDPVLAVADELREAQRRSSADLLRELGVRRQEVVHTATARVRAFASGTGVAMSSTSERETVQTLRAAIADQEVAGLLRRGRLVTAMEYSGFGPAGLVALADSAESVGGPTTEGSPTSPEFSSGPEGSENAPVASEQEIAAARSALDRCTADVQSATVELDAAQRSVDDTEHAAADLADRVTRLRTELARAEQELRFAQRASDSAVAQREHAVAVLESASDAQVRARARFDALVSDTDH